MFKTLLKKRRFKILLTQLRGAKKLRERDDPFFVANIISDLTEVPLGLKDIDFPKALVGVHTSKAEVLLRQIFLNYYRKICFAVMQSIGNGKPVALPLPSNWIYHLTLNGVNCSTFWCQALLYFSALKQIALGFTIYIYLTVQVNNPKIFACPYVEFLGLEKSNLPIREKKESYDIISWYKESNIRNPHIEKIWVQARVEKKYKQDSDLIISHTVFPAFRSLSSFLRFLIAGATALVISILGVLRGKWWYGFLCAESINLHYVNSLNKECLAVEYFFNNSNWFHKPLWTYEAEKRGALVSMYYYSTNIEAFQIYEYEMKETYGLKSMFWNSFIVWDKQQKDYLKRFCPDSNYRIVGLINFSDSPNTVSINSSFFNIAVFDVTPTRPSFYTGLGMTIPPYYSEQLVLKFFLDIENVTKNKNVNLLWKQKRFVGKAFVSPGFIKKRNQIINRSLISIEPSVSANYLINHSDAVISIPFTSTAVIGKNNGLPSVYYDASGKLQLKESHGIPVLKSKDELENWWHSLNIGITV